MKNNTSKDKKNKNFPSGSKIGIREKKIKDKKINKRLALSNLALIKCFILQHFGVKTDNRTSSHYNIHSIQLQHYYSVFKTEQY